MATLLHTIITSLLPSLPTLLTSAHASPPVRLLLLVISPNRALPALDGSGDSMIRSKKSNKYRKGHGVQGKTIFGDDENVPGVNGKGKGKAEDGEVVKREVPEVLRGMRQVVRKELMGRLGEAEWKSMGVDAVGSAVVQVC